MEKVLSHKNQILQGKEKTVFTTTMTYDQCHLVFNVITNI